MGAALLEQFTEHCIVSERAVVPVPSGVPAEIAAIAGCAVITGVGAVLNAVGRCAGEGIVVWSGDGNRCYYVDSPLRRVDLFDYAVATGEFTNRRPFVDTSNIPGIPDGRTLDSEDGVWLAFFGGGRVCRFTPAGSIDVTIELPVSKVTSCCFGGPDLTALTTRETDRR